MSRTILAVAVVAAAVIPVACKKDSTAPVVLGVATNTTLAVAATTAAAVTGVPFSFPGQASALDPSLGAGNLTLTFGGTSTATTATIVVAGGPVNGTATTEATFGSCIFRVTSSTFPTGSRLATGQIITVNPCNMNVATAGLQATGVGATRSVALALGAAVSSGSTVTVNVNPGGQLTLNGVSVGTVTLTPVTGSGS